ncbi:hypothetical protein ARMGADRAFT_1021580 [Armillaria gallica]|uniref:Secreted protein n=1 Tax=Armillaria gallica TaxID=47427 RepID=A0A2H3C8E8_ARMGA|nr:hypothetical protein ARMGADRAFT_1021580 [Armillaria gallica]
MDATLPFTWEYSPPLLLFFLHWAATAPLLPKVAYQASRSGWRSTNDCLEFFIGIRDLFAISTSKTAATRSIWRTALSKDPQVPLPLTRGHCRRTTTMRSSDNKGNCE